MKLGATLPYLQLDVSERGVEVSAAPDNDNPRFETGPYAIDCISYGVQVRHVVQLVGKRNRFLAETPKPKQGPREKPKFRPIHFFGRNSLFRPKYLISDKKGCFGK